MDLQVKVNFHEVGFIPGKDISEKEMESLRTQFMEMYNLWAGYVNQVQEKINETWNRYEDIKNHNDSIVTLMCQLTMEITEEMDYFDWCEKWYKDIAKCVDLGFTHTRLRGSIFRDDNNPIYGVTFIDHPDWSMNFTIELI